MTEPVNVNVPEVSEDVLQELTTSLFNKITVHSDVTHVIGQLQVLGASPEVMVAFGDNHVDGYAFLLFVPVPCSQVEYWVLRAKSLSIWIQFQTTIPPSSFLEKY